MINWPAADQCKFGVEVVEVVVGWYNCEFSVIPLPTRARTGKGWPTQAWTGKGRPGAMAGIDNNK